MGISIKQNLNFQLNMWKELFGDELVSKNGEVDTETALSGKEAVGIYFSAHWCPPCRGFTPKFAEKYNEIIKEKDFEVVFLSSDQDEEAANSYYGEQPWLMMPYADRDRKAKLSDKYGCSGIPYLVILNGANAEVIATNQKGLFHRFFTVNTSADPCKFIRTQTGQEHFDSKPDFEVKLTKSEDCAYKEFGCDRCGSYCTDEERYHNAEHQYDCRKECWDKGWPEVTEEAKVPTMVAIDLKTNEYLVPDAASKAFSKENVEKFAQDIKDEKAKRMKLGEKA